MASVAKPIDLRSQFGFHTIAIVCLFVLYFPILILVVFSINANDIVAVFSGVSTRWYESAIYNTEFHNAAKNTLIIAAIATVGATLFATLAAVATTRVAPWRGQNSVYMVINLPLMVPEIITAVATLSFFALLGRTLGLNFGIGNIILAHLVFCIPFAYMPIRARLESMDLTLEGAAADLYATPFKAFWHVTLPLLMPGISSGAALAFIVSFDDFTITQLVAGPGQTTLPLYIWAMIRRPMTPEINAISTILLGVSILFILISFGIAQRRKELSHMWRETMTRKIALSMASVAVIAMLAIAGCGKKEEEQSSTATTNTQATTTNTTTTEPAPATTPAPTQEAPKQPDAPAPAGGELHIYNWGDYTNPKLIEKFEKQFNIKVTLDVYDSNEVMLAKVREGNTGYDIVVPSDYTVKIMVDDGLLEKTEPSAMENFKNVDPKFVNVYWDDGRHYSVPWQFGLTTYAVDTAKYKGPMDTIGLLFNPPDELKGKINMLDDMNSVIHAAERYVGVPRCSADKGDLKKVDDALQAAKPNWKTFSYDTITKMTSGDVVVTETWNGAAYRMRIAVPTVKFAMTKEVMEGWMDNVAVLKGAKNIENAKKFQNFIMDPENAALISDFAKYDNGIKGSHKFLPPEFGDAPEINPPASTSSEFVPPCPPEVVEIYNKIWTNLKK